LNGDEKKIAHTQDRDSLHGLSSYDRGLQ
jgi:hypothetical protein